MSNKTAQTRPGTARNLPVPISPATPRPALDRYRLPAAFVSQMIAAHDRLAPQRARRRVPAGIAASAYTDVANTAVRRMPAGYRLTADI